MATLDSSPTPLSLEHATPHDLSELHQHASELRAQAFAEMMRAAGHSLGSLLHLSTASHSAKPLH